MDSTNDRMRLKDRILANVAKAVKAVQEISLLSGDSTVNTVTLGNSDWQCHKLCEHLDHALLHGLRHITPGYWKVVSDFTTKEAVKEIKRLRHVTTDLGRGRAWLFMALNENLLESYIRCYQQNERLVKKYYVKEALVLDQQRWNVLLTLTSGLENTVFQLEIDLPYLDLSVYPPKSRHYSDSLVDDDRVSLCSMDSVALSHSKPLPQSIVCTNSTSEFGKAATDSDSASIASCDTSSSGQRRYSPSVDSGCHDDWNSRQRSITPTDSAVDLEQEGRFRRLDSLASVGEDSNVDDMSTEFEVIRITRKPKSYKTKKKKSKKSQPKSSIAVISDIEENQPMKSQEEKEPDPTSLNLLESSTENFMDSLPSSTETSWTSENRSPTAYNDGQTAGKKLENSQRETILESNRTAPYNRDSGVFTENVKGRELPVSCDNSISPSNGLGTFMKAESNTASSSPDFYLGSKDNDSSSELNNVQYKNDVLEAGVDDNCDSPKDFQNSGLCNSSTDVNATEIHKKMPRDISFAESYKDVILSNKMPENLASTNHMSDINSTAIVSIRDNLDEYVVNSNSNHTKSENEMMANHNTSIEGLANQNPAPEKTTNQDSASASDNQQSSLSQLQDRVEDLINKRAGGGQYHSFVEEDDEEVVDFKDAVAEERERARSLCEGEIEMDNNSMLFLMLDILDSDENYVKMFSTRQGHNEGETKVVFLLISSRSLYVLRQLQTETRFSKEAVIPFQEIDYVSLGMNHQLIHVACKNKRNQYWFTTGEERCTIGIMDCLASSMEKSELDLGHLEVDTGAMTQKVALRKYISKENRCEMSETDIICYSLVHWEDPSSKTGACEWDREGHLLYKSQETANLFGAQAWKSAYARLQDGMLCLYQSKMETKPVHILQMGGDQCVGCKRDFNSDKPHGIKIMLADLSSWSVALATEPEANAWLQALCQAVSQGLQMSPARTSCIPCCMVLTSQKLFMCHEDLQTSFVRTLGIANVLDITAVLNDDQNSFYVLAFDSHEATVTSEKWVLYFNSRYEGDRFIEALTSCWSDHFQVNVPVLPIEDFALQKRCREMCTYLKSALMLRT